MITIIKKISLSGSMLTNSFFSTIYAQVSNLTIIWVASQLSRTIPSRAERVPLYVTVVFKFQIGGIQDSDLDLQGPIIRGWPGDGQGGNPIGKVLVFKKKKQE